METLAAAKLPGPAGKPGSETVLALHVQGGAGRAVEDALVVEGPLQIALAGVPYSVTMRTPGDDALLALGLLFTEGVIAGRRDVIGWEEKPAAAEDGADAVDLRLAGSAADPGQGRRLLSNASCGVCGKISAEDLQAPSRRAPGTRPPRLDLARLSAFEGRLRAAQTLFGRTGGCHAAAVFDGDGGMLVLKEDVGRHNAVDKAIGHLLLADALERASLLFISGRVSYEIVTKASKAGIPFLLAVSAPSTLAVRLCREAGITLLAFVRGGKATVYSHPQNVTGFAGQAEPEPGPA